MTAWPVLVECSPWRLRALSAPPASTRAARRPPPCRSPAGARIPRAKLEIPAGSGFQIQSATGINDNGQIIANAKDTATGQTHALLLTPN